MSYLLGTMAISILFTWLFNNTRGSVLLATMLHQGVNIWTDVYHSDLASVALFSKLYAGALYVVTAIVVVIYGAARLSRRPVAELPPAPGSVPSAAR